jgi:hypothetical protein
VFLSVHIRNVQNLTMTTTAIAADATPMGEETRTRDFVAQGVHILGSYLSACRLKYADGSKKGEVQVVNKKGDGIVVATVYKDNSVLNGGIAIKAEDITSYDFNVALSAFWSVTEAAGYGRPLPVDRGPAPTGRVRYTTHFEDVYLRHTILRRSPNRSEADLEPYMPTMRSAARRAFYHWNSVFRPMGFDVEDLQNIGVAYLLEFMHNYAYSKVAEDRIKLLNTFLNQRFGECAKICYKKALNATALPTMVKPDTLLTSDDGEEISYIDTYAESDTDPADADYEPGKYILRLKKADGSFTDSKLEVRPAKMLGVDLYINGSMLPRSQAETLREGLAAGRIQILPFPEVEKLEEEAGESALDRRLRARAELHAKLESMPPDRREIAISYAALSRDYDPDARREARRLAEELACPKCARKVPSGAVCMTCGVEARPRFGIDFMGFRDRLKAANDSMAESLTAPIPDSELRSREKRAKVSNMTPIVKDKDNGGEVSEGVTPPVVLMSKEDIIALAKKLADEFMASLPEKLRCPKCNDDKPKELFGIRVPRNKTTGIPERAVRQSYCKSCRKSK